VTQLSLFRRANVTRLPRILQASRVVAHASYLLSFKPFHTKSAPPSSPQAKQARPLQRPRLRLELNSTRGWRLFPVQQKLSSPHPNSLPACLPACLLAALTLTPPRPVGQALSSLDHCDPLSDSESLPVPVCVAPLSPQTKVLAPHSNVSTEPHSQPRLTSFTGTHVRLRPCSGLDSGHNCIGPGNVALWCEEFDLPIGMPVPMLQNLVIIKAESFPSHPRRQPRTSTCVNLTLSSLPPWQ